MTQSFRAKVDANGKLMIFDKRGFDEALRSVANSDIMISFEKENPNASISTKIYFEKVICAKFREIFIRDYSEHTNVQIITNRLLSWSPFGIDSEGNDRKLESLDQAEMSAFIEHCKRIAAIEFDTYIGD